MGFQESVHWIQPPANSGLNVGLFRLEIPEISQMSCTI